MKFYGYIYLNLRNPMVCWETYRGILISADKNEDGENRFPSLWATNIIRQKNNIKLANELLFESVRSTLFPDKISRLRGLYVFRDLDSAQYAQEWGGPFIFDNLVEAEISTDSDLTKVDANWVTYANTDDKGYISDNYIDKISKYWEGVPFNNNPCWEYIVNGRAIILGTKVKNKAYSLVKENMPETLGILELTRIAQLLGSDLGHITPWIYRKTEETFQLNFTMNFKDATNKIFLEKIVNFNDPKNIADLNQNVNLITPDLTRFNYEFIISNKSQYDFSGMKIHLQQ